MMIFLEFLGIATGFGETLRYFGININEQSHELVSADLSNSSFYNFIFGNEGILIVLIIGGAVIVGFFTKSFDINLILLPLVTTVFVKFAQTAWLLISYVQQVNQDWLLALIATIFIPLGVGYILAMVDWFKGIE
jgi:hypothetical protein